MPAILLLPGGTGRVSGQNFPPEPAILLSLRGLSHPTRTDLSAQAANSSVAGKSQIRARLFSTYSHRVREKEHPAVVIMTVEEVSVPSCPMPVAMT